MVIVKDISTSDIAKKNYNGINNNLTKIQVSAAFSLP